MKIHPKMWQEGRFGIWTFRAAGFHGSAGWALEGGGYSAQFEKWKFDKKFNSLEEAKEAVEKAARLKCDQLMVCLLTGESLP